MKKMKSRGFEDHTRRMLEMKSVVDCGPPRGQPVSKRKEIERMRQHALIEFDNRLVLERLAKVMQVKSIDNDAPRSKSIGRQQARRLELQRITQENQRLLRRIQETEPCYNHLEWEEDSKKRAVIMANMSEFSEANTKVEVPLTVSQMQAQQKSSGSVRSGSVKSGSMKSGGTGRSRQRHGQLEPLK